MGTVPKLSFFEIGLVLSLCGNLDKIYPQVMKDLTVRRAAEAAKLQAESAQN